MRSGHFPVTFFHGRAPGQLHPSLVVNANALDQDLVTDFDDIFNLLDAEVGQFTDVNEPVLARKYFDERSEIFNRNHLPAIGLAHLDFRRQTFNRLPGNLHAFLRDRVDLYRPVVLDIDLASGFFDDALDILASRPNQRADLLRVDL